MHDQHNLGVAVTFSHKGLAWKQWVKHDVLAKCKMNCESISWVNFPSNLVQKSQLPVEKAGLEMRRMSPCHDHIQIYISPFSCKVLRQVASFLLDSSRLCFPSPRFLRVIRLNHLCCFQVCTVAKMMPATKQRRSGEKYGTGDIIVVPRFTTMSLEGSLAVFIWGITGVYAVFSHLLDPFCVK